MTEEQDMKRHYWVRADFDAMMKLLPGAELGLPGSGKDATSLFYPKYTEGAVAELRLRGLKCDGGLLMQMVEAGIVTPKPGHSLVSDKEGNVQTVPSTRIYYWSKEDIDQAAEYLYSHEEYWSPWTAFCYVSNIKFGQAVKARHVAAARYRLGFSMSFDVLGLVTVIEPPAEGEEYAYIRFFPASTRLVPQE